MSENDASPSVGTKTDSAGDTNPSEVNYGLGDEFEFVHRSENADQIRVGRDSVCVLNGTELTLVDRSGSSQIQLGNEPVDFTVGDVPFIIDDDGIQRLARNGAVTHTAGPEPENVACLATMLDESLLGVLTYDSIHFLEAGTLLEHAVISFPTKPDDTLLFESGINSIAAAKGSRALWYYREDFSEIGDFVVQFENDVEGIAQLTDSILFSVGNLVHVYDLWTGDHVETIDTPESLTVSGRGRDRIWTAGGSESNTEVYSVSREELSAVADTVSVTRIQQTPVLRCVSIQENSQTSVFTRPNTIECTLGSDVIRSRDPLTISLRSYYESKEDKEVEIWGQGIKREDRDSQISSELSRQDLNEQISATSLHEDTTSDMDDLNVLWSETVPIEPLEAHECTLKNLTITSNSGDGAIYVVVDGEMQSEKSIELEQLVGELSVQVVPKTITGSTVTCDLALENTGDYEISELDYSGPGELTLPETIEEGEEMHVRWEVATESLSDAENGTEGLNITYFNGAEFTNATVASEMLSRPPVTVNVTLSQTSQSLIVELMNGSEFTITDQIRVVDNAITGLSTAINSDVEYEIVSNGSTKIVLPLLSAQDELFVSIGDSVKSPEAKAPIEVTSYNGLLQPSSQIVEIQQSLETERTITRWNPVAAESESVAEDDLRVGDILVESIQFDTPEDKLPGEVAIWDRSVRSNTGKIDRESNTNSSPDTTISGSDLPENLYRYHQIVGRSATVPGLNAGYRTPKEISLGHHRVECSDTGIHVNAILRPNQPSTSLYLEIHNNTDEKIVYESVDLWANEEWHTLTTEHIEIPVGSLHRVQIPDIPQSVVEELRGVGKVRINRPRDSGQDELEPKILPILPLVYQDGSSLFSISFREMKSSDKKARLAVSNNVDKPLRNLTLSLDRNSVKYTHVIGDLSMDDVWARTVSPSDSLDGTITIHGIYDGVFVDLVFKIDSDADEMLKLEAESDPVLTKSYRYPQYIRSTGFKQNFT